MAKPIKETPILTSKDAVNFYKQMTIAEKSKIASDRLKEISEKAKLFTNQTNER